MDCPTQTENLGASQAKGGFPTTREHDGPPKSSSLKLTPLDMNMPRVYGARWILCFPLPPGTDKTKAYEDLAIGLEHTVKTIPWIAGNIVPELGSNPADNRIQIVGSSDGVKLPCKDLTGALPSYKDLKEKSFPLSRLLTSQIGPIGVFPEPSPPVLAAQANFVEGGLLLAVGVHHSACDASALETIVSTWAYNTAEASGSRSFTTYNAQLSDRSPLMEGIPGADIVDFPEYRLPNSTDMLAQQMPPGDFQLPRMASHVFYFSPESLADIKTAAAAYSTHDALCAFVWRHMTMARRTPGAPPRPSDGEETSALAFAVNIRDRMSPPLPPTYLGNASMGSITNRLTVSALTADGGLPSTAAAIRKSLGTFSDSSRVRLTIGLLQSRPDPTDFKLAHNAFLGPDVVASSWADLKVYERHWGTLGRVEAFRTPGEGADGVVMIFPRLKDGGLEVMIGLEQEAMGRLLEDGRFLSAARFEG